MAIDDLAPRDDVAWPGSPGPFESSRVNLRVLKMNR